jgi:hypothetical protein
MEGDEQIQSAIDALKVGLGATAIALFDDDEARIYASTTVPVTDFWNAFGGIACLHVDWQEWYRKLRTVRQHQVTCSCPGGHSVHGILVHERWVLLMVADETLDPMSDFLLSSAANVLAGLLPTVRSRGGPAGPAGPRGPSGGGPGPAELAIPLWWLRKAGS